MLKLLSVVFLLWYPEAKNKSPNQSDSGHPSIDLDSETRNLLWQETFGLDLTNLPAISADGLKSSGESVTYQEAENYCSDLGDNDEYQLPVPLSSTQNSQIREVVNESTWLGVHGLEDKWYHGYLPAYIHEDSVLQTAFILPFSEWAATGQSADGYSQAAYIDSEGKWAIQMAHR